MDADGDPQNVTGYNFKVTVKLRRLDADPGLWQGHFTAPNDPNGVNVDDAAGGIVSFKIPHATTAAFPAPSTLVWDLQATTPGGDIVTLDSGNLYVLADVTRT